MADHKRSLHAGEIVKAEVLALDRSGAWIGVEGRRAFVPLAEIAWFEVEHPAAMLSVGSHIQVRVIGVSEQGIIECSIRKLERPGPTGPVATLTAVVETPKHSQNVYRYSVERNAFTLYRVLHFPARCPFEIGYLPATVGADGEPLRMAILLTASTFPGCEVACRVVGLLRTVDDAGPDEKLLGVSTVDPSFDDAYDLTDVSHHTLRRVVHYFAVIRSADHHAFTVRGWERASAGQQLIEEAAARYRDSRTPTGTDNLIFGIGLTD